MSKRTNFKAMVAWVGVIAACVLLLLTRALAAPVSIGTAASSITTPTAFSYLPYVAKGWPPTPTPTPTPSPNQKEGWAAATFAYTQLASQRAAVLFFDNFYGSEVADAFQDRAAELGLNVVFVETYSADHADFTPLLRYAHDANADLLYVAELGYVPLCLMRTQSKGLGFSYMFLGSCGAYNADFITCAGQLAEGAYATSLYNYPTIDFYVVNNGQFQFVYSVP